MQIKLKDGLKTCEPQNDNCGMQVLPQMSSEEHCLNLLKDLRNTGVAQVTRIAEKGKIIKKCSGVLESIQGKFWKVVHKEFSDPYPNLYTIEYTTFSYHRFCREKFRVRK